MNECNIGDTIVCIDPTGDLRLGEMYTVRQVDYHRNQQYITVEYAPGKFGDYYAERFMRVQVAPPAPADTRGQFKKSYTAPSAPGVEEAYIHDVEETLKWVIDVTVFNTHYHQRALRALRWIKSYQQQREQLRGAHSNAKRYESRQHVPRTEESGQEQRQCCEDRPSAHGPVAQDGQEAKELLSTPKCLLTVSHDRFGRWQQRLEVKDD